MGLAGLLRFDVQIFHLVNSAAWPEWFSTLLAVLARSSLWTAPIAISFLLLVIVGKSRARLYVASAIITLALTELVVSSALKPLIARPRPCKVLSDVRLVGGCTSSFSMPSGHAANSFGQAVLLGLFYPPSLAFSLPVAGLVSLSRVSQGKHYPSDVTAGAVIGIAVAFGVRRGFLFLWQSFLTFRARRRHPPG